MVTDLNLYVWDVKSERWRASLHGDSDKKMSKEVAAVHCRAPVVCIFDECNNLLAKASKSGDNMDSKLSLRFMQFAALHAVEKEDDCGRDEVEVGAVPSGPYTRCDGRGRLVEVAASGNCCARPKGSVKGGLLRSKGEVASTSGLVAASLLLLPLLDGNGEGTGRDMTTRRRARRQKGERSEEQDEATQETRGR